MGWNAGVDYVQEGGWYRPKPAAYTGPGDIQSFAFWGGLRGYNATYATGSNPAVDLVDQAGANAITINIKSDGTLDAASIAAWITAHTVTTIKVSKLYDQVSTRHLTQATLANMPTLVANSLNSSYGLTFSGSQSLASSGTITQNQQYSTAIIAKQSGSGVDQGVFAMMNAGFTDGFTLDYPNGGTAFNPYAGITTTTTTLTASNWNAVQTVFNGASTVCNVNGSENTVNAGAQNITTETINLGTNQGGQAFNGIVMEAGFIASGTIAGNRTNLNANMHGAYGVW